MPWSPTIRAALLAGTPWLDVHCPGCGTTRAINLRTIDRHPLASVGTLVLGLRCSWCPGSAPMPKLLGLFALLPARRAQTVDPGAQEGCTQNPPQNCAGRRLKGLNFSRRF
jgi:hypothetical protein